MQSHLNWTPFVKQLQSYPNSSWGNKLRLHLLMGEWQGSKSVCDMGVILQPFSKNTICYIIILLDFVPYGFFL